MEGEENLRSVCAASIFSERNLPEGSELSPQEFSLPVPASLECPLAPMVNHNPLGLKISLPCSTLDGVQTIFSHLHVSEANPVDELGS